MNVAMSTVLLAVIAAAFLFGAVRFQLYVNRKYGVPTGNPQPQRINGHTLDEVVAKYLRELNNPAPDPTMQDVYHGWMGEFVDVDWAAESARAQQRRKEGWRAVEWR